MQIKHKEPIYYKKVEHLTISYKKDSITFEVVVTADEQFGDFDVDITPLMDSDTIIFNALEDEEQDEIEKFIRENIK